MSQESDETQRFQENEKNSVHSRLLHLHGNNNHHQKKYFIKKEFLTLNPVNKGIRAKLSSDDLKNYIEKNH